MVSCRYCTNGVIDEGVDGLRYCKNCVKHEKQLVLTESVMIHMLADLDQIITEMELDPLQRTFVDWVAMLRHAVDGEDYKR